MKLTFENTASYEGKLTIDGKELIVTFDFRNRDRVVIKGLAPNTTLGKLVANKLAPILFNIMQAEAIVGEENCDRRPLSWITLGNEKREVVYRLS